jgi:glycine cleavage system H protein
MSDNHQNFMGYMWVQKEDNVYTIGINEEGIEEITEITSVELPNDGEALEADVVIGTIETDDGTLDIYSPVSGKVIEVNAAVLEEPSLIQEDPYDSWLVKIESEDDLDEEDDEDDDDDDKDKDEDEEWEEKD